MQGLAYFDNALLADILKRLTALPNYPNIDSDIVTLAVRIRAELGHRVAAEYAEIYSPGAIETYREFRESE
jgi:hypothetical protein